MWTNTREIKVLDSQKGNATLSGYIAYWQDKAPGVITCDTQRECCSYYTFRVAISVNGTTLNTYGELNKSLKPTQYFSRKSSAVNQVKQIARELGFDTTDS